MTPAARLQATIDILDEILAAARADGAAADVLIARGFKNRRYAGSKDRAAVRDMIYAVLRSAFVESGSSARAAVLGFARAHQIDWLAYFGTGGHAPAAITQADEALTPPSPTRIESFFKRAFPENTAQEMAALLGRAPLFLRVAARQDREEIQQQLAAENIATEVTALSPWGLRCLDDKVNIEQTRLFQSGLIDIQDEGSQLISLLGRAAPGETVIDLCAGAGGKTLALADMMRGQGRLVAHDIDPRRLERLAPRAARVADAAFIQTRTDRLTDMAGQADLVLVDAPCSGTGTWRRNPEARLRPMATRLPRLQKVQRDLLAQAAALARPGGRIVYAVCSVLAEEGEDHLAHLPAGVTVTDWQQGAAFLAQSASLQPECLKLTPYRHGCDGFFIVCLQNL